MSFILANRDSKANILLADNEFKGIKRVAGWVASDIESVTGNKPEVICVSEYNDAKENRIVVATIGKSSLSESIIKKYGIDVSAIEGKREVYGIFLFENELVILGSDKRGSIYGLFKLSETIGVTAFGYWGDVVPKRYDAVEFENNIEKCEKDCCLKTSVECISKEPSVRYRGFFINDEWPAFGNWANKHFGGVNAMCYEKVFEYLLRMKGNYMWPAMWATDFSCEGPGTLSAELADELGVVMGTSHHEPCERAGEEFIRQNKTHPEYGTAWSFLSNRDGITKFWEDGLERGKDFENVITVGMRGERDSKLFEDAKLVDNINVLKDVITVQKELINRIVKRDSKEDVPMMLAIYKEVENYYKGDAETVGLKEWEGLDGITLMLCDDNFGNLRLLPEEGKRNHKGGYGMYYHFDYHGGPISYEWISSSYLPKVWEQMTMAYDSGIRDIWIVNVGDLKFQELPLSYFLDLAYDFDKYGTAHPGNYDGYLREWIGKQFNGLGEDKINTLVEITDGYMRLNNIVKPEVMSAKTYSLTGFAEADRVLDIVIDLERKADEFLENIGPAYYNAYVSLIYFQAKATCNLIEMQIISGKNKLFASQGRVSANSCANAVAECIEMDKKLCDFFHIFNNEKWYSMAKSKHIGFRNWNDEGCRMPVREYIEPIDGKEIVVTDDDSENYSVGGDWCRRKVRLTGFDYKGFGSFSLCCSGREAVNYEIICDDENIEISPSLTGETKTDVHFKVKANEKVSAGIHEITVKTDGGRVVVFFEKRPDSKQITDDKVFSIDGFATVNACEYTNLYDGKIGAFREIPFYGKILPGEMTGAIKAYPQEINFGDEGPAVEYKVSANDDGNYILTVYSAPSNPSFIGSKIRFALQINDNEKQIIECVDDKFEGGENSCIDWCKAVLTQIRKTDINVKLTKGTNTIKFYAMEPQFVLEKFVIKEEKFNVPETYLGPVKFDV